MTITIKEMINLYLKDHADQSFSVEELSKNLKMTHTEDYKALIQNLAVLEREKQIQINNQGRFKVMPNLPAAVEGLFHAHEKGFGFVTVSADEPDVFIAPDATKFAMNGDQVAVEITHEAMPWQDKGAEGKIVGIVERKTTQIVGEFKALDEVRNGQDYYGFLTIKDKKLGNLQLHVLASGVRPTEGEICLAEVTHYPDEQAPILAGMIKQVLGHKDDPGMDILEIVYSHGIPIDFSSETMDQANRVPDEISPEDEKGRVDLTGEILVTIDGESAKDLDDAVGVSRLENGNYRLIVSIADVSYYVTEGSPMDREAYERGTSVYLTDRVIPMIPHRLSNGICSLNPQVKRLTMTCEMEITPLGEIIGHKIYPSVIKTAERMTYTAVNEMITEHKSETIERYQALMPMFTQMAELHHILEEHRVSRGAINFDDREASIEVDEKGKPTAIILRDRGVGERMIESFMLAANETVAEHFNKLKVPFIYRIHEQPDETRMMNFIEFLTHFGIMVKGTSKDISPKTLQGILDKVAGTPEEAVISTMLLRSMKQAKYSEDSMGHYGLAAEYYTHFTSPIRRYPDLIVHRLIRSYLTVGTTAENKTKWSKLIPEIAEQTSRMERRAVDAERDTDAMKKAEFMLDQVGQAFPAIVSSVTKFGMFVELDNTVEGLIHISNMKDDYYTFIESHLALVGRRTKKTFRIGQPIEVKLEQVNVEQKEVDFSLVPGQEIPTSDLTDGSSQNRGGGQKNRSGRRKEGKPAGKATGNKGNRKNNDYGRNNKNSKTQNKNKKPYYKKVKSKQQRHV